MNNQTENPEQSSLLVKRRRATCSSCRRRKSRCDNRHPRCSTCVTHNSSCHYDRPPSLAYVRSLESKIQELIQQKSACSANCCESQIQFPSDIIDESQTEVVHRRGHPDQDNRESCHWAFEISSDSYGGVCYHNPTSAIHEAVTKDQVYHLQPPGHDESVREESNRDTDEIKNYLVSNAAAQRQLESIAVANVAIIDSEVSSDMANDLMKLHWCWIHPMFMFVYRPAFMRDMALCFGHQIQTPYFSEALLRVLLAHSSRFYVDSQNRQPMGIFMTKLSQQANLSLAMTLTKPSSIPTIQALLQQSARDLAFGNSSQAWLYSGMAFRIAIDLGIHLPSEKLRGFVKSLTEEEIEIRKRLFWSCFTWDKAISLYLGRMPAFTPIIESKMPVFMDDFTENDPWEPYYGASRPVRISKIYPPTKGHIISCFAALCSLSIILKTVMLEIYGSAHSTDPGQLQKDGTQFTQNRKNSAVVQINTSIQTWWTELPVFLRLDVNSLPEISPPLHIVSLNLLYHTTLILVHRPFIIGDVSFESKAVVQSYQVCKIATAAIHDLLELLITTFGSGHISYLNCYCTYIAATIAVLKFQLEDHIAKLPKNGIHEEKLDLKFFLGILQQTAILMPALDRSIEIIKRHMQKILEMRAEGYLGSLFAADKNSACTVSKENAEYNSSDFETNNYYLSPIGIHQSNTSDVPLESQSGDEIRCSIDRMEVGKLPAFPGQDFNFGYDAGLGARTTVDPQAGMELIGLDSYLTLYHETFD